jgi:hypothetical protein
MGYLTMMPVTEITATNDRAVSGQLTGKDVEGHDSVIISGTIPLTELTRSLSQNSLSLGPDLNPGLPRYEA